MKKTIFVPIVLLLACSLLTGCGPATLTLYTDLPRETVEALTAAFTEETGVPVTVEVKTAGSIGSQAGQPDDACDVILLSPDALETMLSLDADGRLSPVLTANEAALPWALSGDGFVGMGGDGWTLLVNTDRLGDQLPDSIFDMADYTPGLCGLPDPQRYPHYLVGVYRGWDESLTLNFFERMLEKDVQLASNPGEAADRVAAGDWEIALTTLAEARKAAGEGAPVSVILPDQNKGELGTLVIPVTVAAAAREDIDGNARKLMVWLLRVESEKALLDAGVIDAPVRELSGDDGQTVAAVRPLPSRIGDIYGSVDEVGRQLAGLLE